MATQGRGCVAASDLDRLRIRLYVCGKSYMCNCLIETVNIPVNHPDFLASKYNVILQNLL